MKSLHKNVKKSLRNIPVLFSSPFVAPIAEEAKHNPSGDARAITRMQEIPHIWYFEM